jgi:chromosomal replication initiation ATPase DnaA
MNTATLTPPATLADIGGTPPTHISEKIQARVLAIILATADEFGLTPETLTGRLRTAPIAAARHAAVAIVRIRTKLSTVEIGYIFANRDHGTVLNSIIAAAALYSTDADFRESYDRILSQFPRLS